LETPNGWEAWGKHVLAELKRLDESHQKLVCKVDELKTEVAILKVKYGIIGGIFGAIPGIVAIVMHFVK
jgi:hypothetical protein